MPVGSALEWHPELMPLLLLSEYATEVNGGSSAYRRYHLCRSREGMHTCGGNLGACEDDEILPEIIRGRNF